MFLYLQVLMLALSCLVMLSSLGFAQVKAVQHKPGAVRRTKEEPKWVEQTLKMLSLEEKVGQMLQVRYYADYKDFESKEYQHVRNELQKYHIGSVIFGMHFNRSGPLRSSPLEAAGAANQLQRDSKLPLLLVERFASITAREARAIGVQWALAPVADVNSNPANPVINDRSFGEDPEQVGALVAAFIRGAHANGLLVTAKHFPGNGDTSVDSHRALASIDGDLGHLRRIEFPPFKRAIDAGVDSILLAHASVPALEPDPEKLRQSLRTL